MSEVWLIEDSPDQLRRLESLLTDLGHFVHAFQDPVELLEQISGLPFPGAVVVNLGLRTTNGFQAAEAIRKLRPDIAAERFLFTSGWKSQFIALTPDEFGDNVIIDKANWTVEELETALDNAIKGRGGM